MMRELLEQKNRVIYEDEIAAAVLPNNAATKGHIVIIPKKEARVTEDLSEDELEHIFYLSSYAATTLFETLGMEGTNIITKEGEEFYIDIIGRKQDDGLNFQWKPKQLSTEDLDQTTSSISGKIILGEQKEEPSKPTKQPEHVEGNPPKIEDQEADKGSDEEDYMIKQLRRIP